MKTTGDLMLKELVVVCWLMVQLTGFVLFACGETALSISITIALHPSSVLSVILRLGEVEEVVGITGYDGLKYMKGESTANAILRFKNGKHAQFEALVTGAAINTRPFFHLLGQKLSRNRMW